MHAAQGGADIIAWHSNTLGGVDSRGSPGQRAGIIRNPVFCELIPDAVFYSRHDFHRYLHRRTDMKDQPHRSKYEPGQVYDQLVTDSMILSEKYVESAIKDNRNDAPNPLNVPQGMLNGLILSLLLWILVLLPFLVF